MLSINDEVYSLLWDRSSNIRDSSSLSCVCSDWCCAFHQVDCLNPTFLTEARRRPWHNGTWSLSCGKITPRAWKSRTDVTKASLLLLSLFLSLSLSLSLSSLWSLIRYRRCRCRYHRLSLDHLLPAQLARSIRPHSKTPYVSSISISDRLPWPSAIARVLRDALRTMSNVIAPSSY